MHHSTYFGVNITRETDRQKMPYAFPGYRMPYSAYAGQRFVYADTLEGIRRLIRENR